MTWSPPVAGRADYITRRKCCFRSIPVIYSGDGAEIPAWYSRDTEARILKKPVAAGEHWLAENKPPNCRRECHQAPIAALLACPALSARTLNSPRLPLLGGIRLMLPHIPSRFILLSLATAECSLPSQVQVISSYR